MDRRKNSPIWNYFTVKDFENKTARCDQCGVVMSYRGTITNLKNHIIKKHPTINLKLESNVIKSFSSAKTVSANSPTKSSVEVVEQSVHVLQSEPESQPNSSHNKSDTISSNISSQPKSQSSIATYIPKKVSITQKKKIDQNLLKMFIQDFQPFSIVEDSGFKAFVNALNPSYDLPSRKLIANNFIPAAYEACKTKVANKIKKVVRVCLTTDCWSSSNNDSYLALTAHFINDSFQLESILLDCLPIEGSHTSKNLAETIKKITDSYGLSDKILIVVSDNAANIVGAINELNWKHFGCYAHTINLIVHNALETVQDLQEKARLIVTFFKRSNLATEKLMKFQRDCGSNSPKKLIQDVPTRWNATFLMLQRLVLLQDAVKTSLALSEKDALNLTSNEWKKCSELVEVLEPFESITREMSGERFLTGSQIIVLTAGIAHVCSILMKKSYHSDILTVVADLQKGISTRLKNIEHSKTVGVCTFLDPRFKQHAFTSQTTMESIKDTVIKLVVQEYNKENKLQLSEVEEEEPPGKKKKNELSIWGFFDSKMENLPQTNPTCSAIMEVQRYVS